MLSKCVKPVVRMAAEQSMALPSLSAARNAPGAPSKVRTVVLSFVVTLLSETTRVTMPPTASLAHRPDGTNLE
jgi:hypothetical protein